MKKQYRLRTEDQDHVRPKADFELADSGQADHSKYEIYQPHCWYRILYYSINSIQQLAYLANKYSRWDQLFKFGSFPQEQEQEQEQEQRGRS